MCSESCPAQICEIDYYGVLNLKKSCNELDIKKAFEGVSLLKIQRTHVFGDISGSVGRSDLGLISNERYFAIHYNPERNRNETALEAFMLIAEAYEVLSNPLRRAIYDQYGATRLKSGLPGPNGYIPPYVFHGDPMQTYYDFFGTKSPYADLLNILENPDAMIDITGSQNLRCKDESVITPLDVTLTEIFFGAVKKVKLDKSVFVDDEKTCTKTIEKILTIIVDPGIPTGTEIVFPEEGDQKPNRIPADIVFVIKEKPHERFRRENDDLLTTADISLSAALTGTVIKIHTLDNKTLRIPITSIITPTYSKNVPREGLPKINDPASRGDLIINFRIEFPMYLSVASKRSIKEAFE